MLNTYKEYDSSIRLVVKKYKVLQKINPRDRLLTLLKDVKENEFTITDEFLNEYYCEDKKECIYPSLDVFGQYYLHLELAISKELNKNGSEKINKNYFMS